MSHLQNKSDVLQESAKLLHDKNYYSAVAHSAYYSCYQLLKHIWLHSMNKTESELKQEIKEINSSKKTGSIGSHEYLINQIISYIENSKKRDCGNHARDLRNKLIPLKRLRVDADYSDTVFDRTKGSNSISLSNDIIPILKKY